MVQTTDAAVATDAVVSGARKAWTIAPRAVLREMRSGVVKTARDLSWLILNTEAVAEAVAESDGGDSAESNCGLAIIEQALDFTLGLAVLAYLRPFVAARKLPKPFTLCVGRGGRVWIVTASGRTVGGAS